MLGWVVVELGCPEWWVGLFGLFELGWVVWVGLFGLFGANTTQPNTTQPNSKNPTHMQNPTQPKKHDSQVGPSVGLDSGRGGWWGIAFFAKSTSGEEGVRAITDV